MLISKRHRFIFVHIYKNAGTSITAALKPFVLREWQWWLNRQLKKRGVPSWFDPQPLHPHASASEMIKALGRTRFDSHFSFAFVRNPWDWQVSLYKFILKDTTHHQHDLVKSFDGFDSYLRWRCAEDVQFQKDFIYSNDGELLVDFVGRHETVETDFQTVCTRVGIVASLPKLNVSNTKPYREYYTDETRELIRRTFAADIALFDYTF